MYALKRGSLRFKLIPHNVTNITDIDSLCTVAVNTMVYTSTVDTDRVLKSAESTSTALGAVAQANFLRGSSWFNGLTKWGMSFAVPFYAPTHSLPTISSYAAPTGSAPMTFHPGKFGEPNKIVRIMVSSVGNLNLTVARYAGDDFNFGQFTGVPPQYLMEQTGL